MTVVVKRRYVFTYGIYIPPPPVFLDGIVAGSYHSFRSDKNKLNWTWGLNSAGQLGNYTSVCKCSPVAVAGVQKTFCRISGGSVHTTGIDKNGLVWSWGANNQSQLGNNTAGAGTCKCTPVAVVGATKTFCQIAATIGSTIGLDVNGKIWSWGLNTSGQLGNNSVTCQRTPVGLLGVTKTFCKIFGNNNASHSIGIDNNNNTWVWGLNDIGQLGINSVVNYCTPTAILGVKRTFCKIASGTKHTLAIDNRGKIYSWGNNGNGQLGQASITCRSTPIAISGVNKTFCQISAGSYYSMGIDLRGKAYGWGVNGTGQIGDNSTTSRRTPVAVLGALKTFCQISTGTSFTLAVDYTGKVWAWGDNTYGQLGNKTAVSKRTPIAVCNI